MSELNLMKTHKRLYAAAGALELATGDLIGAIAAINMWNRIGVLSQK